MTAGHAMIALLVNAAIVAFAMAAAFGMSWFLGRSTHSTHKDMPYESGMAPTGDARLRTGVPYYLVAIFFLMFDVEIAFLWAWGANLYELSWPGLLRAFVFIAFLTGGLAYIWLRGGLVWRRPTKTAPKIHSSSRN